MVVPLHGSAPTISIRARQGSTAAPLPLRLRSTADDSWKRAQPMAVNQEPGELVGSASRRRLSDRFFLQATIGAVEQITRTMRLIRLDTAALGALESVPGQ